MKEKSANRAHKGPEEIHDVAIVGGGPAGLALALALRNAPGVDVSVAVVERGSGEALDDPRGWAIAEGPRRVLEAVGAWADVAAKSGEVREMVISDTPLGDAVRPSLLNLGGTEADDDPVAWIVPAGALHGALVKRTTEAGIAIRAGTTVTGFEQAGAFASLSTASGDAIRARLVVAADGVRSPLRSMAGIRTVGWDYGQTGIVTTVSHRFPHEGRAFQHFLPGGPFALLPLPGNRSSVVWTEESGKAKRLLALDDLSFMAEFAMRAGPELGDFSLDGPRGGFPLNLLIARKFAVQRLALIGDAAHRVHPLAGQGLNLGLKDVAALAEVIVDSLRLGIDPGSVTQLAAYERWRRFDVFQMAVATDGINRLFSPDIAPLRVLRDIGMGLVDRSGFLKKWILREAAGLTGDAPKLVQGLPL
ncbi:MAG: FAD-dependent monooxygenase [Rhodobiaceae bacterium]|nr:FAD-dependent monooxygenase [Rhodobiaceae bacterium]MCC0049305.1 FAD-dependent monooxygenase [Rhodobiaceae bacterium]